VGHENGSAVTERSMQHDRIRFAPVGSAHSADWMRPSPAGKACGTSAREGRIKGSVGLDVAVVTRDHLSV